VKSPFASAACPSASACFALASALANALFAFPFAGVVAPEFPPALDDVPEFPPNTWSSAP